MEKIDDGVLKKLTEGQHFKAFCEKVVFALKSKKATVADQQLVLGFKSGRNLGGQPTRGVVDEGRLACWARKGKAGWWRLCKSTAKGAMPVRVEKLVRT